MSAEAVAWSEESSDAELITAARGGDSAAFGALYERHAGAARTVARQYTRSTADADDVVSDAFARVYTIVRGGGGPDVAFRAYLFTVVRRLAHSRVEAGRRLQPTDDMAAFESAFAPVDGVDDPALAGFERGVVAKAYGSLPERWQAVLWYTEIERLQPAQVAPLLGLTANGVAALAYRAREGLREAYLQQHLVAAPSEGCRTVNGKLGAYVRGGLAKRESAQVRAHLETCETCRSLVLELGDVNHGLRGIIAPLVLGVAGLGALASPLPVGVLASVGAGVSGAGAAGMSGAGAAAGTATGSGAGATGAGVAGTGAAGSGTAAGGGGVAVGAGTGMTAGGATGGAAAGGAAAAPAATTGVGAAAGSLGGGSAVATTTAAAGAGTHALTGGAIAGTAASGAATGTAGAVGAGAVGAGATGAATGAGIATGTAVGGAAAAGSTALGAAGSSALGAAATASTALVGAGASVAGAAGTATAATASLGASATGALAATGAASATGVAVVGGSTALVGAGAAAGVAAGGLGGLIAAIPGGVVGAVTAGVVGVSLAVGGALVDPTATRATSSSAQPDTGAAAPGVGDSGDSDDPDGSVGASGVPGASGTDGSGADLATLFGPPPLALPPSTAEPSTSAPEATEATTPDARPASAPTTTGTSDAPTGDRAPDPGPASTSSPALVVASSTGGPLVLVPGTTSTVSVTVTNTGDADATSLRAALLLPGGVEVVGGAGGGPAGRWQPCVDEAPGAPAEFCLAELPGGGSSVLMTEVRVDAGATVGETSIGVHVGAAGAAPRRLTVPADVVPTAVEVVLAGPDEATLTVGTPARVTFAVTDAAPGRARDLVATVALPAGVRWVGDSTEAVPWDCAAAGGALTCVLPQHAGSAELALTLAADPEVAGAAGLAVVLTVADAGGPGVARSRSVPLTVVAAPGPPLEPVPTDRDPLDPAPAGPPPEEPADPPAEELGRQGATDLSPNGNSPEPPGPPGESG